MRRFGLAVPAFLLATFTGTAGHAASTNSAPDFNEVYQLLKSHLPGLTEADLNRQAVEGLLTNLRGKVSLVSTDGASREKSTGPSLNRSNVMEDDVAYLRVSGLTGGLPAEISAAYQRLSETNKLKGIVLDLRFAGGEDFAAAAAAADLFLAKERPLLDWGEGMAKSKDKENAIRLPVAVLVNRDTSGAAEAMAAILRETGAGLILGGTTAGGAMIAKDFPLRGGQHLRIATVPVKLGDGSPMSAQGVKPDIEVAVSVEEERAYFKDAYATLSRTNTGSGLSVFASVEGTNRPARRPRISEADLVRERREGTNLNLENFTAARDREPEKPLIRDPVLARAVDLLKGLAVVRRARP
jgi:C-terminal processing protease CtpA/Prc